jgi:hypothetical protein
MSLTGLGQNHLNVPITSTCQHYSRETLPVLPAIASNQKAWSFIVRRRFIWEYCSFEKLQGPTA